MKNIITLLLVLSSAFLSYCSKDNNPSKSNQENDSLAIEGYNLVWNDEFNGTEIDKSKWEHEVNGHGGGNNELQYYTDRPENSFVANGLLNIVALREEYTGTDGLRYYTSARLRTLHKGDWKYGRFEIKAILPYGQGLWPAIWLLPTEWKYGGWAASGEIDIMEMLGHETDKIYGTIHYGGTPPNNVHSGGSYRSLSSSFAGDFHVFRFDWEENEMRWYVDDKLYLTQKNWYTNGYEYPAPFDQLFHMILNVAVGGNWPGNPTIATQFPQVMQVDYVRVYQKK